MGAEIPNLDTENEIDYVDILQRGLDNFELRAQSIVHRYIIVLCRSNAHTDLYYWRSHENGDVPLNITVYEEFPVRRTEVVRGFITNGGKHYCEVMDVIKRDDRNAYYHIHHNEITHIGNGK